MIGSRNNERIIDKPLEVLNNDNISAVVTSARAAELLLSKHPNVFTTAPDISSVAEVSFFYYFTMMQRKRIMHTYARCVKSSCKSISVLKVSNLFSQGVVTLVNQLGSSSVAIISSCSHALKAFESIASQKSILMKYSLVLEKDDNKILDTIVNFLREKAEGVETVVLMLESMEMERFVSEGETNVVEQFQQLLQDKSWILGSVGVDEEFIKDWSVKFHSNLLVLQPHVSINLDFKNYLLDKLTVKDVRLGWITNLLAM